MCPPIGSSTFSPIWDQPPGQVDSWIGAELPHHLTERQIYAFLDGHELTYRIEPAPDPTRRYRIVFIQIGERSYSLIRSCTLAIEFDFAGDGLVQAHHTTESCYSL